ncbi:MAG: M42 family metallopeptidase [Clostridia bacterium]|nr:M42 family metallopeptidase [Clostridia bacterium]
MIDFEKYAQYYKNTLLTLMNTPSPSGYYQEVMPVVKSICESDGCSFGMTRKGCGIITVKGEDDTVIGCAAHCDTLGAMVRHIAENGDISFTRVGGPMLNTLDGEYCTVLTRDGRRYTGTFLSRSPAAHVYDDAESRKRDEENMYVRLDEVVSCAEDIEKLGIENGNYIFIDPKTEFTPSGFIKSRFIDDKASVACLLTAAHIINEEKIKLPHTVKMLITIYEEVGHGASWIPSDITEMLGVDMGCVGKDLSCDEYKVSICAKDSFGPYDYALTNRLVALAKENGLDYAVDIYPHYGSDVGAMYRSGYDVPGALIGTGVHASHGMERAHMSGIKNTVLLILSYLLSK